MFSIGYRRAKSTQANTNFQKEFFGEKLRDHYSGFHFLCSFFCLKKKNKVARLSDSLQIFRRALLWSHLFPTVWMRSLAQKIMGFLSTRLSLPRFFGRFEWEIEHKKYTSRKRRPCRRLLLNLFFDFTTAFQDKIKQRERSVLEKWGKDVSCRRIFTKLRESAQ